MNKKLISKGVKILVIAILLTFLFTQRTIVEKIETKIKVKRAEIVQEKVKEKIVEIKNIEKNSSNTVLDVPFICQAPLQTEENWKLHEESCEEAALLQVYLYETNQSMGREEANIEILKMIDWQEVAFGGHYDLKAEKMIELIKGYYKLTDENITVIENATLQDIRDSLKQGHPIIAPVTSGLLDNPNYPYPGYHMLAIKGITEENIITNDNGTRKGESYPYKIETFMEALIDGGGFIITLQLPQS